jgi:glycosyltransferase involved in cell wall biosynthesis
MMLHVREMDLSGGGGAERHFSDTYDFYQQKKDAKYELFFITDEASYRLFQAVGRLGTSHHLILLRNLIEGKARIIPRTVQLLKTVFQYHFDLIHVCLPSRHYLPFLFILSLLPRQKRPKITINVVDCSIAHNYFDPQAPDYYGQLNVYRLYFNWAKLDGIFSWYQYFKDVFAHHPHAIKGQPKIVPAQYCFTNLERFRPLDSKENHIVYAARMVEPKRPLFFLEAVKILQDMVPTAIIGWRFFMFGKGPLESVVHDKVKEYGLENLVCLTSTNDMAPVFAKSKVFVSTQDFENFTSLSMLEAMACGNAIISRNVGQTDYFVKEGQNGFLLKEDTPTGLANAILEYIKNPDFHQNMREKSIKIATKVHTVENFLDDIERFWTQILGND